MTAYTEMLCETRGELADLPPRLLELAGRVACAIHAGDEPPDVEPLERWLRAQSRPEEVSRFTADAAVVGSTVAGFLLSRRLALRSRHRRFK